MESLMEAECMLCVQCSTPVPDTAKYCHNCGSLVSDAEGQAEATAALTNAALNKMEQMLREDTAGEFEIERRIGKGGMAVVYLATEVMLARKVARDGSKLPVEAMENPIPLEPRLGNPLKRLQKGARSVGV